jgi:hypothetical protein
VLERGWIELPQGAAQLVDVPATGPDQGLVGPGEHLQRLGELAVAGQRPVVLAVSADQFGQHLGVAWIRLGVRHGVSVAVAAHRERVQGIHLVPGRHQALEEQAAVGLDPDHHRRGVRGVLANEFVDAHEAYNRHRSHSALGYLPPAVFAAAFNQPELS